MSPVQTADALVSALRNGDGERAKSLLDKDAVFLFPRVHLNGADKIVEYLCGSAQPIFREGEWDPAREEKGEVFVSGRQGPKALQEPTIQRSYDGLLILQLRGDRITQIKLQPVPRSAKPQTIPLKLTQGIKDVINSALGDMVPLLIAFTGKDNQPRITPRGSIQVYSDTQLSVWIRDRDNSKFLKAIAVNPKVALYHMNTAKFRFIEMTGLARVDEDPAVRDRVYALSPEPERDHDFIRHGVAVIIDLETLEGSNPDVPGTRIFMKRA